MHVAATAGVRVPRASAYVATFAALTLIACNGCSSSDDDAASADGRAPRAVLGPTPDDAGPDKLHVPPRSIRAAARWDLGDSSAAARGEPDPELAPFQIIGRVDRRDPAGPRFGWPGSQLRARFSGTGVSLDLEDTGTSHYDVVIDEAAPVRLIVSGPRKTYDLVVSQTKLEHEIVLTKRTETFVGITQVRGVAAHAGGALIPTRPPRGRRIEVIGDSITCGFGVLGADETCPFSPDTESEPLAWGALAAAALSATRTTIAASGIGVLRNFAGDTDGTMPDLYGRALATDPASTPDQFFVPDVVVVNLGTNDFAGGKGDPGPAFVDKYTRLLATLRARHPKAKIVAATSPMLGEPNRTTLRTYLEAALKARGAAGDTKLTLLDLDEQSTADGLGCGYHLSQWTQQKMAAKLVAHLRAINGW